MRFGRYRRKRIAAPLSAAKPKRGQGFTLIEVMVAVLLIMVAAAGIVPLFLAGLSQASSVRYKSLATNVARERMEQIRQFDYREITGVEFLEDTIGTQATVRDIDFTVSYGYAEEDYAEGTLKKITVNVTWDAPPTVSAASITTLIHQQFLGPRGSFLEVIPSSGDPLGTPFDVIAGTTRALYHIAEADWNLVYSNLNQTGMAAKDVYMRLVFFDDAGRNIALGAPGADYRIDKSYLHYATGDDGLVKDIWFDYIFDAWSVPDGYWELRAVVYNEYGEPGNVWRLRMRIEKGAPEAPIAFTASPQEDNQTVLLTWTGGAERDRSFYVLEALKWQEGVWSYRWSTELDADAVSYTDQGDAAAEVDPWGNGETQNSYQYRLHAVDICDPGNIGPEAVAETGIPPAVITTTTTLMPPETTSTSTTSTTAPTSFSVDIRNLSNKTYNLNVQNAAGTVVFTGSVSKNVVRNLTGLAAGDYLITASSSGRPTLVQSFSLPAQAGQIVLTIL